MKSGRVAAGLFLKKFPGRVSSSTQVTEITIGTGKSGDIREKYVIKKHKNLDGLALRRPEVSQ